MTGAAATAPVAPPSRGLLRVLGAAFGLAVAIGATIGGGILRSPGDVAAQLPDVRLFMAVWIFGAVNALLGATVYAELGAMIPRSGGIYTFAQRAMGDGMGFFVGFTDWLNWLVAPAALVLLVGEYLGALVPPLAGHPVLAGFAVFAFLLLLQWQGVVWGGKAQEVTSLLKTLALLGLVIAAFVLPHEAVATGAAATRSLPGGMALVAAVGISLQGVIFTYDAYYAVVYCGEEMKDPGREIPRSIFRGLFLIVAIYLLVNAAFLAVVPVERMAGDPFVGATVAKAVFGAKGDAIIRAIMIVSVIGTVNAFIMAAPRILLAMSNDGLFPKFASKVNAGGTPVTALVLSAIVIAAFVLSGSYNAVLAVDTVLIVVLYVITFSALFVLRRKEPDAPRPYRAWGYPWVPGLALLLSAVVLAMLAWADAKSALITLGLMLVSWPVGRWVKRVQARGSSA